MTAQVQDNGLANLTAAWVAYATRALYLQWGVGSGEPVTANVLADTTGTTENRTAGVASQQTTTTTNDTYQVTGTITASGTRAITELGVFDDPGTGNPPTGGNMDIYGSFSVVNLGIGDSIAFTVKTVFDQA